MDQINITVNLQASNYSCSGVPQNWSVCGDR